MTSGAKFEQKWSFMARGAFGRSAACSLRPICSDWDPALADTWRARLRDLFPPWQGSLVARVHRWSTPQYRKMQPSRKTGETKVSRLDGVPVLHRLIKTGRRLWPGIATTRRPAAAPMQKRKDFRRAATAPDCSSRTWLRRVNSSCTPTRVAPVRRAN